MESAAAHRVVLDVRSHDAFRARRVRGAVHIPLAELVDRMFELPPKGTHLHVVAADADDPDAAEAVRMVIAGGWPAVTLVLGAVEQHQIDLQPLDDRGARLLSFAQRMWQPSPLIVEWIDRIEGGLSHDAGAGGPTPAAPSVAGNYRGARIALDLGCGSGRDAAYLASRGWFVVGVENRVPLARKARDFACRFAVSTGHDPLLFQIDECLPMRPGTFDLIVCVRFLHRPLLRRLTEWLAPGGFLLYSHFVDGVQHVGTPKHPSAYLMHDELVNTMATANGAVSTPLHVLHHEETRIGDGRPIVNFIGRKPTVHERSPQPLER
jgi:SAM-dependent methyltransferase